MAKKKLVIALGGNALGKTPEEQLQLVKHTAKTIADLVEEDYQVIVGHGNGPQVGMINNACEFAATNGGNTPFIPFPECGAMSQGYIGYHLVQAIHDELLSRKMDKDVASIITQVVVDEKDSAFQKPTKPIGAFLSKEEADAIAKEKGFVFVEDAGRGYRRVVASPLPKKIIELNTVNKLVESGTIVVTVGGGGIPVSQNEKGLLKGVPAVIDKDRSCSLLAKETDADMLIILTAVEHVCINFNKPDQKTLDEMTVAEAKQYIKECQFAPGSMLPKIEACIEFVENTQGGKALITSLEKAKDALSGKTGTILKA